MTQEEKNELKELLLANHNSVTQDGIVVQFEANALGDKLKEKAGRVRALLNKL